MNNIKSMIGVQSNAATMRENSLKIVASACGVLLRNGAVILPGAFPAKVLRDSVKTGWVDVAHEWDGEPIGMFDKVYMDGDLLMIEASFHSHDDAQKQRQIIMERIQNGKEVAVSIGYQIDYEKVRYFESGKELWDYCEGEGYPMDRMDSKIKKESRWCWIIPSVTELNEVSICNVGMNPTAKVLEVNGSESEQNDLGERVTLADALDSARVAVERAKQVQTMRAKEQRNLSPDRLNQLSTIHALAGEVLSLVNAQTNEQTEDSEANRAAYALLRARLVN